MNVDLVCTHAELAEEAGGITELENLLPLSWAGSSETVRRIVLREILRFLENRVPPIREEHIAQPSDLKTAVLYGSMERIFAHAMTTPDSIHAERRKIYERKYQTEMNSLRIDTPGLGSSLSTLGISLERR